MKKEQPKIETTSLADIKCPICGGPVNRYVFASWMLDQAILFCECWSGNIAGPDSPHHLFKVITKPLAVVDLTPREE